MGRIVSKRRDKCRLGDTSREMSGGREMSGDMTGDTTRDMNGYMTAVVGPRAAVVGEAEELDARTPQSTRSWR